MKQIVFFKKTCVLLLFVLMGNAYLPAQTPGPYASFTDPASWGSGNNSCNAGLIVSSGYFSFPVPTGLTLSQLNHLETDFFKPDRDDLGFQIIVQDGSQQIALWFHLNYLSIENWTNSGDVTSSPQYSEAQAEYGNAVILDIRLWNLTYYDNIIIFDNTIINTRIYNYDDCDGDGLLDIFDCSPQNSGNNKVLVCHEAHTICVAQAALQAHLAHGDFMGSCSANTRPANNLLPETVSLNELKLYPSPASNQINILNNNNKPLGTVNIYDISGKIVYKNLIGSSQATIDIMKFSSGVYYLRSDQIEKAIKFVKQ